MCVWLLRSKLSDSRLPYLFKSWDNLVTMVALIPTQKFCPLAFAGSSLSSFWDIWYYVTMTSSVLVKQLNQRIFCCCIWCPNFVMTSFLDCWISYILWIYLTVMLSVIAVFQSAQFLMMQLLMMQFGNFSSSRCWYISCFSAYLSRYFILHLIFFDKLDIWCYNSVTLIFHRYTYL